jgi:hypothetical protein
MEYMTARQAAEKWSITVRRVQVLCAQGRINGTAKLGNMWIIPIDAKKPEDNRYSHKMIENT